MAFTLIELLVVVAILAILLALLMPSLRSARESAKSACCVNNLRTLSTACQLYANDFDDYFPDAYNASPDLWYSSWHGYVRHYLGNINGNLMDRSLTNYTANPGGISYEIRNIGHKDYNNIRYGPRRPIYHNPFFCPSTTGSYGDGTLYSVVAWGGIWSDYGIDFAVVGAPLWNATFLKTKRSSVRAPERTMLIADCYSANGGAFGNTSRYQISPRHNGFTRANVSYVDGHVESCRWQVIWADTNTQDISISSAITGPPGFKAYMAP